MHNKVILFLLLNLCFCSITISKSQPTKIISLQITNISLANALKILAKELNKNIIISSEISDQISLSIHNASTQKTFNNLITTHNLIISKEDGIDYILPKNKFLQRKQSEAKFKQSMLKIKPIVTSIFQIHYADAIKIGGWLNDKKNRLISPTGNIHIDKRSNQLIIRDTANAIKQIETIIKKIDIPIQQILIETRIVSIDNIAESELGIEFSQQTHANTHQENNYYSSSHHGLSILRLTNNSFLDVNLSALEKQGHGEIISCPKLFTANRQTAFIESGEEIPYQEISKSGATGVSFRKAVLSLKVTPQILPLNKVLLKLKINQDKPTSRIVQGVPSITTRQISTSVLVKNGQTIVLGGIYENSSNKIKSAIPILNKIPIAGYLFQKLNNTHNKRELLIFVTPWIISPP